jgi:hypothetical protein
MNSTDRKQLIPWLVAAGLFVALVLCVLWILLHDSEDASDVEGSGDSSNQSSSENFIISGTTTPPIKPGVSTPLDLSLTNTGGVAILVSSLTVTLSEVTAPNADPRHPCSAADFTVHQAADGLRLSLSAGESARLSTLQLPLASWPRVQMMNLSANQDGCKQATLTLDYSGAARRDE